MLLVAPSFYLDPTAYGDYSLDSMEIDGFFSGLLIDNVFDEDGAKVIVSGFGAWAIIVQYGLAVGKHR